MEEVDQELCQSVMCCKLEDYGMKQSVECVMGDTFESEEARSAKGAKER